MSKEEIKQRLLDIKHLVFNRLSNKITLRLDYIQLSFGDLFLNDLSNHFELLKSKYDTYELYAQDNNLEDALIQLIYLETHCIYNLEMIGKLKKLNKNIEETSDKLGLSIEATKEKLQYEMNILSQIGFNATLLYSYLQTRTINTSILN